MVSKIAKIVSRQSLLARRCQDVESLSVISAKPVNMAAQTYHTPAR